MYAVVAAKFGDDSARILRLLAAKRHLVRTILMLGSIAASLVPHLHRDSTRPCHICTGTRLTPATSAPGLGSPLPHLHQDSAQESRPSLTDL